MKMATKIFVVLQASGITEGEVAKQSWVTKYFAAQFFTECFVDEISLPRLLLRVSDCQTHNETGFTVHPKGRNILNNGRRNYPRQYHFSYSVYRESIFILILLFFCLFLLLLWESYLILAFSIMFLFISVYAHWYRKRVLHL